MMSSKVGDRYNYYVQLHSFDPLSNNCGILITQDRLYGIKEYIKYCKSKYIEWQKVAIENNVNDLKKKIQIKPFEVKSFFIYGKDFHYDLSVQLNAKFVIVELDGVINYVINIYTSELTSSTNKYIKMSGGNLIFSNVEEIDDFLLKLSDSRVKKRLSQPKVEDLFKN